MKEGFGLLKWSSGDVYEGNFQNDERHGMGNANIQMELFMKETGNMISKSERELKHGRTEIHMKENGVIILKMVKGHSNGLQEQYMRENM